MQETYQPQALNPVEMESPSAAMTCGTGWAKGAARTAVPEAVRTTAAASTEPRRAIMGTKVGTR
ncbi:hypothetical protein GCM10020001_004470 [Nonomuraea salmonea]